jgi:hypothetical protein
VTVLAESRELSASFAPSALNRLLTAVERLPAQGWWIYRLLFVALVLYHHVSLWLVGGLPAGSWSADGLAGLAYGPYLLFAIHVDIRVAARAIAEFRPASGLSDVDYSRARYELTTLPAGGLWVPAAIGVLIAIGSLLSASGAAIAPYGGTRANAFIVFGPASLFGYVMAAIVTWALVRQLIQVNSLLRRASALDLYDTAPIYAFSRLTGLVGVSVVFVAYYTYVANSAFQVGNVFSLSTIVAAIVGGLACFVLPLWGIHDRLVMEKSALVRGANQRAQALQAELYRRVDAGELTGIDSVTDAIDGVIATRSLMNRLPTWPWPPEVLRGFVTAVLLPVIVYAITTVVGAQLD